MRSIPTPKPATVLSVVALSVALAGGGYAASDQITGADIKNRSITGADIKPNSINARHLRPNSVGASEIRSNAVRSSEIRDGQVRMADLAPSERSVNVAGAQGPQGPAGPSGPPGPAGSLANTQVVEGPAVTVPPGEVVSASATCPPGTRVTGGGFFSSVTDVGGAIPSFAGDGYFTIVHNDTGIFVDVNAYAICAS